LSRAALCPSPETEVDAASKTLAAFFASKIPLRRARAGGGDLRQQIFDNNRVLQEEPAIFMA